MVKRQPVPFVTLMALLEQLSWHAPHSMQRSSKTIRAFLFWISKTL
jgi:hypothetical protein